MANFKKFKYTAKKVNKEDPLATVIVKENITAEFDMRKIDSDISYLEKNRKEIEGQVTIAEAKKQNVLNNYPWVKKMSQHDQIAVYLYYESDAVVREGLKKLEEVKEQLNEYDQEKKEIVKQTGLDFTVPEPPAVEKGTNGQENDGGDTTPTV
jgi:hypothetical protein